MVGWLISVYRVADEEAVRRILGAEPGAKVVLGDDVLSGRLAVWQAGPYGLNWIAEAAAREGGVIRNSSAAIRTDTSREPPTFSPAKHRCTSTRPGSCRRGPSPLPGYVGKTTIDDKSIDECSADQWLYIEVWDES